MKDNNYYTLQEILNQHKAWDEAIHVVTSKNDAINLLDFSVFDQIIFIGCGSTYYLSLSAATIMQSQTGKICKGVPSSEIFLSPDSSVGRGKRSILCAISRSGTTSETLHAVRYFSENFQGDVITVTNNPESPLAAMGRMNFIIPKGYEHSIAQTQSFASMFIAVTVFALLAGNKTILMESMQKLPSLFNNLIAMSDPIVEEFAKNKSLRQFYFLGSGPNYGLACEASLKLKEMSLSVSEPFHFMEFRHGPISMVDEHTLVIGLISDNAISQETAVLSEAKALGAQILSLGEKSSDISFNSDLPEPVRRILYLPPLQLLAFYRSIAFGLNPDQPRNLSAVVTLSIR